MSTSINPLASPTAPAIPATPVGATKDPLADKSTFLRLLVSQLQNQNPLNPVDGNQFLGQLTSYSQLEQLIGIHQDTSNLTQPATPPAASVTPGSK